MVLQPVAIDDRELADAYLAGDAAAWSALRQRYEPLVSAVVLRVLDERRPGHLEEVPGAVHAVFDRLQRGGAELLQQWQGGVGLGPYFAVIARQACEAHAQDATPVVDVRSALPTPAAVFLDDLMTAEPARRVRATLDRLSPHAGAIVRLRSRELDPTGIAAALGTARTTVLGNLERLAARLGEMQANDGALAVLAWRLVLDCAPLEERVRQAIRSEEDPSFHHVRSIAEAAWLAVRERMLARIEPRPNTCLRELEIGAFVEGSIGGERRAEAELHLATCVRCVDAVAMLSHDIRVIEPIREARNLDRDLTLAAACMSTGRYLAGERLAARARQRGMNKAETMYRLARLGLHLVGGIPEQRPFEPSQVVTMRAPCPEDVPVFALESLFAGNPQGAARAVDNVAAKSSIGARLRLLADAAGHDIEEARRSAALLIARKRSDPGLREDAKAVQALPPGHVLPREILIDRLRSSLPAAVRHAVLA